MKPLFRLLGISVVALGAICTSRPTVGAPYYNTYVMGKAGNRARNAQILRNEAIQRQQQQLKLQEEQKKQKEQQQAAATNNVPNPPNQNSFGAPMQYYAYRAVMPTNSPAKAKAARKIQADEPRSLPLSEFSGPAYNDNDPLLGYQRQQAEKGNPESQYAMGLRYLDGNGVTQSDALAREWLSKSSANGNLKARTKLRELDNEK